jgi:flavodoxin
MRSLIVSASTSHGNARRVADRMAEVPHAEIVGPENDRVLDRAAAFAARLYERVAVSEIAS